MSIPTWYEIKKTGVYKEARKEVIDLINSAPATIQLSDLRGAVSELLGRVEALEAEVAVLKAAQ